MRKNFLLLFLMALLPLAGWAEPADIVITVKNLSKVYGAPNPAIVASDIAITSGTADKATIAGCLQYAMLVEDKNVGAHDIEVTQTSGTDDYNIVVSNSPKLNITVLDISASDFTVTFDAASYTFTGSAIEPTITSLKIGDLVINSADYVATFSNNEGAGTGKMSITGQNNLTGSKANIAEFEIVGGLSLADKTATYAGDALTYTGVAQTPTNFTIEGLTYGTDFEVKAGSYQNNTAAGENTASVVLKGKGNYAETSEITATFSIAKAAATITPAATAKVFGAAEPTFTATVVGAQNGEELVYTIKRKNFGDIEHEQPSWYSKALYVEYDAENAVNKNYAITTGEANFAITKKSMTAGSLSYQNIADQVYDATKAASANGITTPYTLKCKYAALTPTQYYTLEEGTDFTVTYSNNTAVGVATVTFKGAGTKFNDATEKSQTFNITAKPVTINAKVEPATVGYGAEYTPDVTWGDGVTDADKTALGDINYTYKKKTSADPATATKPTAVGEYYVYAAFATANANYSTTINEGEFAITNGDLQAKVGVANVTYGVAPTFSIVPFEDGTSFPAGSAVTAGATYVVKNASNETMTCDLNKLPVGIYTVTNTATATNYNVVVAAGTFEVSARDLTDNAIAVTALDAKPYVGAKVQNPSTTGKITFTYPNTAESYTLLEGTDYTVSNEGFDNINAGATAGSIKLIAMDGSNFSGEKTVNFEIEKADLTITANEATWEYGTAENPATRYSATYTLLGQDAEKDLTTAQDGFHGLLKVKRIVGETVGTYTNGLEVSFEDADGNAVALANVADNYNIATVKGKLTIDPSTITLVVDDKVGVYGDDVSSFASTLSLSTAEGDNTTLTDLQKEQWATFVNTTGVAYTLAAAADGKYLVGTEYEITATGATSTNYNVKINPGKYTVKQREIEITATDQSIAQGASLDQTAYTVSNGAKGYTDDDLGVTLSTVKTAVGGPYADAITVAATNPNYDFHYVPGALTITAATSITLSRNESLEQLIKDYDGQDVEVKFDNMTMKSKEWYAIVLPFATTPAELVKALGQYVVCNVLNTTASTDQNFKFTLEMDELPAGVPFLIKPAQDLDWADFNLGTVGSDPVKKTIVSAITPAVAEYESKELVRFTGSYTSQHLQGLKNDNGGEKVWWLANSSIAKPNTDPVEYYDNNWKKPKTNPRDTKPMEAYLIGGEGWTTYAPNFTVEDFDGQTTSIKTLGAESIHNMLTEGWYTLNGVKLQSAPTQKGVYINNGKKVVIR